ncbi:MAG: ATP-binding protein [Alphaproteobacteria bacterium]|nr:ATP-binding protein [Alphaproteobacteria bacterium]
MASDSPLNKPSEEGVPAQRNRAYGFVVDCDGTQAKISTMSGLHAESKDYWAVGQLLSISVGKNRVVGLLHKIESETDVWKTGEPNPITLHVELSGEVRENDDGSMRFSSGITIYPHLGSTAHRIRKDDLVTIYKSSDKSAVTIGSLSQASDIPAVVSVDSLLSRHFSVVGTTGTGKSTAVTLLLHLISERKKNQRILILDPHNEYTSAFGKKAHTITAETLDLPFWLLNLEEFTQVIFRGRDGSAEEIDALREFIPRAKVLYMNGRQKGLRKQSSAGAGVTADTPVPYRLADLLGVLDEEIDSLDGALRRLTLRRLKARLEAAINDPRFGFMFGSHNATDRIETIIGDIYRVPIDGKPITVFQMSGIPSEVVNSVASVLCRLAFDLALASDSRIRTLVVCEEAHRYIPTDAASAFAPTRSAIARIAKEGRKYGVSLAIITQRPNELDPTILSQCNTIFTLRLGNDADQDVMRKAIANGSRSTLAFLSSLADRECIAFGSAVSTPMRMMFRNVPPSIRPSSQNVAEDSEREGTANASLTDIVFALRGGSAGESEDDLSEDWVVNDDAQSYHLDADEADKSVVAQARSSLLRRKS